MFINFYDTQNEMHRVNTKNLTRIQETRLSTSTTRIAFHFLHGSSLLAIVDAKTAHDVERKVEELV